MITEKFPLEALNAYYVGREFVRISPITKCVAKGTVKEISLSRISHTGTDGTYYSSPQIGVVSTENIHYYLSEIYFNLNEENEKRAKIVVQILEEKELERISKIVE